MNIALIGAACVLGLAATGSAIGAGIAGMAAIGSWKRAYMNNKPASFLLVAFAGAPLTQTIYGFILMGRIINSTKDPLLLLAAGAMVGSGHRHVGGRPGTGCGCGLRCLRRNRQGLRQLHNRRRSLRDCGALCFGIHVQRHLSLFAGSEAGFFGCLLRNR